MRKWPWFLLALFVVVIDQLSKYWVSHALPPYEPQTFIPMVNWMLAYNSGAAFSFLSETGAWHRWFFVGFSGVMSVLLAVWMIRLQSTRRLQLLGLSFILGGAIGNLIDRAYFGYVVDFIDVFYKNYHWPTFNVADSAICIGAGLLLIELVMS